LQAKTRQISERKQGDPKNKSLKDYVEKSAKQIGQLKLNQRLQTSMQEILYHVLNHQPFVNWLEDPERTVRLGELTRLFEVYSSSPVPGYPGLLRGSLKGSGQEEGKISWRWRQTFYNSFVTLIIEEGLNDPEDEDQIYPTGYLPIMTVHQSKGLEFPFVFIAGLDANDEPSLEHILEQEMSSFRKTSITLVLPEERVKQDAARFY
jgi:DNA helicase-2/ATP-dependent DNA helicase PcrA